MWTYIFYVKKLEFLYNDFESICFNYYVSEFEFLCIRTISGHKHKDEYR